MADNEIILASAVVIPDAQDLTNGSQSPTTASLKRRQSDTFELDTSKRARLSTGGPAPDETNGSIHDPTKADLHDESITQDLPTLEDSNGARPVARRPTGRDEERKRGQRMFGALLGALAGSSPRSSSGVQKRRADIEKRTQAKLLQIDETERKKEQDNVEKIRLRRRREQWIVDEQALKTRHDNLLTTARYLRTKADPPLYYKPWELRPDEEGQIARQIEGAEDQIDRELDDFERRRRDAVQELDRLDQAQNAHDGTPNGDTTIEATGAEPEKEEVEEPQQTEVGNNNTTTLNDHVSQLPNPQLERKEEEVDDQPHEVLGVHHGETMVKTDEDTVIY